MDTRKRDLAQIHVAKKQLSIADDSYRAILRGISDGATDSAADLDHEGRQRLLDHLKRLGFKSTSKAKPGVQRARTFPDTPQWRKLWSLWQQLADVAKVADRRGTALVSFVKNESKVDAMDWVKPHHLNACIEALKAWLSRE